MTAMVKWSPWTMSEEWEADLGTIAAELSPVSFPTRA